MLLAIHTAKGIAFLIGETKDVQIVKNNTLKKTMTFKILENEEGKNDQDHATVKPTLEEIIKTMREIIAHNKDSKDPNMDNNHSVGEVVE